MSLNLDENELPICLSTCTLVGLNNNVNSGKKLNAWLMAADHMRRDDSRSVADARASLASVMTDCLSRAQAGCTMMTCLTSSSSDVIAVDDS